MRAIVVGLASVLLVLLALLGAQALTRDDFYTYGRGLDNQLPKEDEVSSPEIPLNVPIRYFGEYFDSIYVNMNGLLSFSIDLPTFINAEFPLGYPIIAQFYTNVDTTTAGSVYYREAHDAYILARAKEDLEKCFPDDYHFEPTDVFIATWSDVGYHKKKSDKTNTFQTVIISDGNDSYVLFLYPEDGIQWLQAKPQLSGISDARAQVGFTYEQKQFLLKHSGTEGIRYIASSSNCGEAGKYMYRVGDIYDNVVQPHSFENNIAENQLEPSCSSGGFQQCHHNAKCVDKYRGFCCECNIGYYGNGKTCIKKDQPLRVQGVIKSELNGEHIEDIDLQSYIVLSDGRTYSALANVPEKIGYGMQTLNMLGGIIGWLFAKPTDNTKNGFQITGGVFNNTAEILFLDTNQRVIIKQRFLGLNLFDQLKIETEIKGSIPIIPPGSTLEQSEYTEQYTTSAPGLIISRSTRSFINRGLLTKYPIEVTQTINYHSCPYMNREETHLDTVTLKISKHYLGYESEHHIVRYGMSNRIYPLNEEDPCIKGREICGSKSTCVVEDDTFRCVCQAGYQNVYVNNGDLKCLDIDECATESHNCDVNAVCINLEGSFQCECNSDYEGNGVECNKIEMCINYECDFNAECVQSAGSAYCVCNEGFSGTGNTCTETPSEKDCNELQNCSPYASCIQSEDGYYNCECNTGYEGDGYTCNSKESEYLGEEYANNSTYDHDYVYPTCILSECLCPFNYTLRDQLCYKNEEGEQSSHEEEIFSHPIPICITQYACACPLGFKYNKKSHKCKPTNIILNTKILHEIGCNVIDDCHPYAICVHNEIINIYECQCTSGYTGDGKYCESIEPSCKEENICDPNASCEYDPASSKYICVCKTGYQGNGYMCTMNECFTSADCEKNAECKYTQDHYATHKVCVCKNGYSKDDNDACIPDSDDSCNGVRCAQYATCLYDSKLESYYCHCDEGYHGDGLNQCTSDPKGCFYLNDCDINAECLFIPSENEYKCVCNTDYHGDGYTCTDQLTCENDPYLCSSQATCVARIDGYVCECNPGYVGNGTLCRKITKHDGNFLLLNQGMATLRIPFTPNSYDLPRPIQIMYNQMAVAIDTDCIEGKVYWSDITGRMIKSSNYDGTVMENTFIDDIISPEGMSIDWVSRNIYWTDSRKDTIEVANLNSKVRKTLFKTNLVDPRGIAVHPYKGKIFWSDWNRKDPKIEWSNMDGSDRKIFLDSTSVTLPNSLAIDWNTEELCFADAGKKTIECVHLDTMFHRTVVQNCSYPFGLTITPTHYYWTDWITQKVESMDKETQTRLPSIDPPLGGSDKKLYEIAAVLDECRHISNICEYNNGDCSRNQLCLLNGRGGRSCVDGDTIPITDSYHRIG